MVENAEKALADESVDDGRPAGGLKRVIRRAPLGVTFLVGAWNVSSDWVSLISLRLGALTHSTARHAVPL